MNFEDLLTRRRKVQMKKMSRYLKYIFNDHFVIVMVFLLGALAFQYSQFLKSLSPNFIWGKVVVALVLSLALFLGKLSTLVEGADQVFLSSMEKKWHVHLQKSKRKSMLFPSFLLFLLTGISMPLLFLGQRFGLLEFLPVFLTVLLLKGMEVTIQEVNIRVHSGKFNWYLHITLTVLAFLLLLVSFFINAWISLGITFAIAMVFDRWYRKKTSVRFPFISWEKFIQLEENRIAKMNRIINLFTDAPHAKNHAKRRKYLDSFARLLSDLNNPYQYLYIRIFLRGNSYSGLFLRLSFIGFLVLLFTSLPVMSSFLSILFLYLTGFQLIPLYFQLDENVMAHLYPQPRKKKFEGFQKILMSLLLMESVIFSLAILIGVGWETGLLSLFLNFFFIILFKRFYIVKRTQKRDQWAF